MCGVVDIRGSAAREREAMSRLGRADSRSHREARTAALTATGDDVSMEGRDTVRVVLADDHPVVRDGLRMLLASLPGVEVVGEAATGKQAVREAVLCRPDVVVMDVRMPDLDGIEATRELLRVAPGTAVLMLTMVDDDDSVFAAMRAGARGYVLKGAGQEEISRAIRSVASGEAIFGPGVAERALRYFSRPPVAADPFPTLTGREREVLDLIVAGMNNTAIAARLGLSAKTIGNHLSAVFAKLQVSSRSDAIARARDAGLGRSR
jgi:DNA-binding NarL/FixJ family response regulator